MQYKTYTGVVLKRASWREADEILTLWSVEEGKIRLLARGLKRQNSKLKGILASLAWVEVSVSSALGFPVIIGARKVRSYSNISETLPRLAITFNVLESVLRATADRQASPQLSVLLQETLALLALKDEIETGNFFNWFLTKLITILGFGLTLDRCGVCGQNLSPRLRTSFSYLQCGLVCQNCGRIETNIESVSPQVPLYLTALQTSSRFYQSSETSKAVLSASRKLLEEIMNFILEREIHSRKFLDEHSSIVA